MTESVKEGLSVYPKFHCVSVDASITIEVVAGDEASAERAAIRCIRNVLGELPTICGVTFRGASVQCCRP